MGLLDFLKRPRRGKFTLAPTMSGQASYNSFGDSLYASEIVVQSIRCKANEMMKLEPRHIRTQNGTQTTITDSSVARVLNRPNELMTTAEFLEKITILRELNKNAYIYPEYYITRGGEKCFTGLYPLKPRHVEYQMNDAGRLFIEFTFQNGGKATLPASDVIHWRKDYGVNDYFGGGNYGGADSAGLIRALTQYDALCQSIAKAIDCSCSVNGIVKYNSYISDKKADAERESFIQRLKDNASGILFTDMKTEYIPITRDVRLVDAETLKFFYESITRANGVSVAILNGDYNKAQKEAFYEHALEADIKALGQAIGKTVFSDREAAFGNEVVLYPNDITFMSMENKIAALQAGLPAGIFTKNEAREMLGYPPIEGGDAMPRGYNELDETQGGADNDEQ